MDTSVLSIQAMPITEAGSVTMSVPDRPRRVANLFKVV